MPGKEQTTRNEPQKGFKPFLMASLAGAALLLSSCTAPIQDAFQRMGSARNTTFVAKASCPSIEGEMNNALFYLVEPTTSLKIENGLVFKGKAYSNGSYVLCLMENASNGYVIDLQGNLVRLVQKGSNGTFTENSKDFFKYDNKKDVYELVYESDFPFGQTYGKFALRKVTTSNSVQILPQPTPMTPINRPENNGKIDFIQTDQDTSPIGTIVVIGALFILVGSTVHVIRLSRKMDLANRNRSHGPSGISDIIRPDPKLLEREQSPIYPYPPNQRPLPPIIIDEEPESLMDRD
jgi:hypothetical protein